MKLGVEAWIEAALFGCAALLFLGAFGFQPPSASGFDKSVREPGSVRVMTWNVGQMGGTGGAPLDEAALQHVADVITELEPDLVFLQELEDRAQLRALSDRLGDEWSTAISRPGERRVAALAPRGELQAQRLGNEPTRSLTVELRLSDGRALLALCLHADAWSSAARNAEIGASVDALLSASSAADIRTRLFVGDLNIDLDLDKRGDLFSDDAHRDVETYNYVGQLMLDTTRGTGFTAQPDRRLDYIFAEPASIEVLQAGPLHGLRVCGMDHEPLVADLLLP